MDSHMRNAITKLKEARNGPVIKIRDAGRAKRLGGILVEGGLPIAEAGWPGRT